MKQEPWRRLFPWKRDEPVPAPKPRLDGELTVLRDKRLDDVDRDYEWRADPELADLDATSPIRLTLAEFTRYYRDELEFPSPWSVRYAIDTLDGTHIGNAMYYDIDRTRSRTELGIMIGDRRYWGRGYGTDAVITLLRSIFLDAGLEYVYLHTLDYNERAQRAFKKAGFQALGQVHRDRRTFMKMEVFRTGWLEQFDSTVTDTGAEPAADGATARQTGRDEADLPSQGGA